MPFRCVKQNNASLLVCLDIDINTLFLTSASHGICQLEDLRSLMVCFERRSVVVYPAFPGPSAETGPLWLGGEWQSSYKSSRDSQIRVS